MELNLNNLYIQHQFTPPFSSRYARHSSNLAAAREPGVVLLFESFELTNNQMEEASNSLR